MPPPTIGLAPVTTPVTRPPVITTTEQTVPRIAGPPTAAPRGADTAGGHHHREPASGDHHPARHRQTAGLTDAAQARLRATNWATATPAPSAATRPLKTIPAVRRSVTRASTPTPTAGTASIT